MNAKEVFLKLKNELKENKCSFEEALQAYKENVQEQGSEECCMLVLSVIDEVYPGKLMEKSA